MGVTWCHIKGIFSLAATRWQIVLHSQQVCQTARHREEATNYNSRSDALKSMWSWLPVTSTGPLGAAITVREVCSTSRLWSIRIACMTISTRRATKKRGSLSIIQEAFADTNLTMPLGTSLCAQGQCRVIEPPDSYERWKVHQHGAFSIPPDTLGFRPKDQSCHHEMWLQLALVNHHGDNEPREWHELRLLLKERSAPYQPSKERGKAGEDESDRSLSSKSSIRTARLPTAQLMKGTHDRDSPRPSFCDLMRPWHLCSSLLFVHVFLSLALHHISSISHITLRSWLLSPEKRFKDLFPLLSCSVQCHLLML